MVAVPELRGPNLSETDLTIFDFSGSQLIFPLPDNVSTAPTKQAPQKIDLYDDTVNFVGNPAVERYIEILRSGWNYIATSSSLIAGGAHAYIFLYTVHKNSNLYDQSVLDPSVFKQWVLYKEGSEFEEINKRKKIRAEFCERVFEESELCVYPKTEKDLNVYFENNTPKCHVISGDPKLPRLDDSLYIPVSNNHVLSIRISFGGFPPDFMGPKDETDKLLDGYAKEFFSHVRVIYNPELREVVEDKYGNAC